jgi:Cu/Ag efflux protein CusF
MPAMTMDYKVAEGKQIEGLKPGDTISADLVVGANIGHLEKIVVMTKAVAPPAATPVK